MDTTYWDRYYTGRSAPILPSQFAVFMLGEINPESVVDIGCGSGRDSFWFAQQGIPTLGVDGSQAAIDMCRSRANGAKAIHFIRADVGDPGLAGTLLPAFNGSPLLYARFFLHAINEREQSALLGHVAKILGERGGAFAVEYRTVRDKALTKVTDDHYRRYITPSDLIAEAALNGLACAYSVEGFGFAKYKADDAYCSRMIFQSAATAS